jgi:hypothetical protein
MIAVIKVHLEVPMFSFISLSSVCDALEQRMCFIPAEGILLEDTLFVLGFLLYTLFLIFLIVLRFARCIIAVVYLSECLDDTNGGL